MADQSPGRKIKIIIVVAFILVVISAFAWFSIQLDLAGRQSERHDYTYSITLSYDTALENVTMLLPVPELNGTPFLVQSLVNGTGYGVPPDWNLSIVERNGTLMLAVTAARMVPDYHGYPVPIESGESPVPTTLQSGTEYSSTTPVLVPVYMVATISQNTTINTRDPIGHEPVFAPDGQFTPAPGTGAPPMYSGTMNVHPVPLYIRYSSDRPATLSFWIRIEGMNSIWKGGWQGNTYSDTILLDLRNGTQGWIESEGTLVTGEGVYY